METSKNITVAVNSVPQRSFLPSSYAQANLMPNSLPEGHPFNASSMQAFKPLAKDTIVPNNPLAFNADNQDIMKQLLNPTAQPVNPQFSLGATMGYESTPIHTWTREQLEQQLMILKQREMERMQGPQQWLAGKCSTMYQISEPSVNNYFLPDEAMPPVGPADMKDASTKGKLPASNSLQQKFNMMIAQDMQNQMMRNEHFNVETYGAGKLLNDVETMAPPSAYGTRRSVRSKPVDYELMDEPQMEPALCRVETKLISTDDGAQRDTMASDTDSEFEFMDCMPDKRQRRSSRKKLSESSKGDLDMSSFASTKFFNGDSVDEDQLNIADSFSGSLRQDYLNFRKHGILTNELRNEYIRRSKLYPKVRGVWFNSTVRRMGWVGQAYKKCKRIEKIFSISKHGFEGARELAIEFRNSQKPTVHLDSNDDSMALTETAYSVATNDEFGLTETIEPEAPEIADEIYEPENHEQNSVPMKGKGDSLKISMSSVEPIAKPQPRKIDLTHITEKVRNPKARVALEDQCFGWLKQYTSNLTDEQKSHRDFLCKEALRFMLYELSVLMEFDVPVPLLAKDAVRKGVQFHIEMLEACKTTEEMMPYMAIFGEYICKGITPVDVPFNEIYSILRAFSHCRPLTPEFSALNAEQDFGPEEVSLIDLIKV